MIFGWDLETAAFSTPEGHITGSDEQRKEALCCLLFSVRICSSIHLLEVRDDGPIFLKLAVV